jgi:hypothetical protein
VGVSVAVLVAVAVVVGVAVGMVGVGGTGVQVIEGVLLGASVAHTWSAGMVLGGKGLIAD